MTATSVVQAKQDHFFSDHLERPVVVVKIQQQVSDWELAKHQHIKSQFLVIERGVITLETDQGIWLLPPNRALWIPAFTMHTVQSHGPSSGYVVFIDDQLDIVRPNYFQMFDVTAFLKALLERSSQIPHNYTRVQDQRLMQCVLDEILIAPHQTLHLAMPKDAKLKLITSTLLAQPHDQRSLAAWAELSCMSERSLTRKFLADTGISIGQWKKKLHVILALQWLSEAYTVQYVADRLAYDSDTSFISMFKKIMGAPPRKYMQQKRSQH